MEISNYNIDNLLKSKQIAGELLNREAEIKEIPQKGLSK